MVDSNVITITFTVHLSGEGMMGPTITSSESESSHSTDSVSLSYSETSRTVTGMLYQDPHDPAHFIGRTLSNKDRLQLLTLKHQLPDSFEFPVTSGRRFNPYWLINRPWLPYSVLNDSLYFSVNFVLFWQCGVSICFNWFQKVEESCE